MGRSLESPNRTAYPQAPSELDPDPTYPKGYLFPTPRRVRVLEKRMIDPTAQRGGVV
jgi:hypothetical protein